MAELQKSMADGAAAGAGDGERLAAEVKRLEAEVARLHEDLHQAAAAVPAETTDVRAAVPAAEASPGPGPGVTDLRERARDVYDGINSALSELRTTIITAKGLFGEVGPKITDEDARRALGDALVDSMERTEDAKGLLRTLKELAEG